MGWFNHQSSQDWINPSKPPLLRIRPTLEKPPRLESATSYGRKLSSGKPNVWRVWNVWKRKVRRCFSFKSWATKKHDLKSFRPLIFCETILKTKSRQYPPQKLGIFALKMDSCKTTSHFLSFLAQTTYLSGAKMFVSGSVLLQIDERQLNLWTYEELSAQLVAPIAKLVGMPFSQLERKRKSLQRHQGGEVVKLKFTFMSSGKIWKSSQLLR